MKHWPRVLSYFRPELPRVVLALLFMGLSIGANVLKPWPVALIIDHILAGRPAPGWFPASFLSAGVATMLALAALSIFILHAAQGAFAAAQNYLSIKAGLAGLARLRAELFAWMQRLSLAFYQRRNQGDLIYRATWDTYSIQTIFQQGLFKFLNSFVTVLLMVVVMWRLNVSLTLITLAVFPPLFLCIYFFGKAMNRRSLAAHQADSRVTALVQQNIASLPVVQSYARETRESNQFGAEVQKSFGARVAQHGTEVTYWLVIATVFGAATAALTWWGARSIVAGQLTVGELVIFLSYLGQLYDPLNQLSNVGSTVADANAGTERIFEILDNREMVSDPANPKEVTTWKPGATSISFENIRFGYSSESMVLHDLSFTVSPGETVGLVGPSGAGKTTLLNLIPRFYDPAAGVIRVAGTDIREVSLRDLREQVAFVFQESLLLPGTIAANIAYGSDKANAAEIENAARLANAHGFIMKLPQGFETVVGEGAARLSVGEKQRISIARAFLKNAPILLLDEPTSALDLETEELVIESLGRLIQGRTTVMAAHRLTTLRNATRILVLEKGRITEEGSPAALARSGGYYSRALSLTMPKW